MSMSDVEEGQLMKVHVFDNTSMVTKTMGSSQSWSQLVHGAQVHQNLSMSR